MVDGRCTGIVGVPRRKRASERANERESDFFTTRIFHEAHANQPDRTRNASLRALVCLLLTSYSVVRLPRRLALVLPERPVRAAGGTRAREGERTKRFLNQFLNGTSSSTYHIPWISCFCLQLVLLRYCSKYTAVVAALGRLCTPSAFARYYYYCCCLLLPLLSTASATTTPPPALSSPSSGVLSVYPQQAATKTTFESRTAQRKEGCCALYR